MEHFINTEGTRKYIISISDIQQAYSHYKIDKKSFIKMWKSSANRQMYEEINFYPIIDCPINSFNTFTGFTQMWSGKAPNFNSGMKGSQGVELKKWNLKWI